MKPSTRRSLKALAAAAAALLAIPLLGLAWIAWQFDAAAVQAALVQRVAQHSGRALVLQQPLRLQLWPEIGVRSAGATLSQPDGRTPFAEWRSARIALAIAPLLRGELVVSGLRVDGLQAEWRDMPAPRPLPGARHGAPAAAPARPLGWPLAALGRMELVDARLRWRGADGALTTALEDLSLTVTGLDASRDAPLWLRGRLLRPGDGVAAALALDARLRLDADALAVADLRLELQAEAAAAGVRRLPLLRLQLPLLRLASTRLQWTAGSTDLHLARPDGDWHATLAWPEGERAAGRDGAGEAQAGWPGTLRTPPLRLAVQRRAPATPGGGEPAVLDEARATAVLDWFAADAQAGAPPRWSLSELAGEGWRASTAGPLRWTLRGGLHGSADGALQAVLDGELDAAPWALKLGREPAAAAVASAASAAASASPAAPRWHFDLEAARIDIDRLRGVPVAVPVAAPPGGAVSMPVAAEASAVDGRVRVAELRMAGLPLQSLQATLRRRGARWDLAPLSARVHGGRVAAEAAIEAPPGDSPSWQLQLQGQGLPLAALWADLRPGQPAPLDGIAGLDASLQGQGLAWAAIVRSLHGRVSLQLRDGAWSGPDLRAALRQARRGSAPEAETGHAPARWRIAEFSAEVLVAEGQASSQALHLRSPRLRADGQGRLQLADPPAASLLDLQLQAAPGEALLAAEPWLRALRGARLPLRLHGPLADPQWQVDADALAEALAGGAVVERLREGREAAEQRLKDAVKGRLQNLLRR